MATLLERSLVRDNNQAHKLFWVDKGQHFKGVPNGEKAQVKPLPRIRMSRRQRKVELIDDPLANAVNDVGLPGTADRVAYYTLRAEAGLELYSVENIQADQSEGEE